MPTATLMDETQIHVARSLFRARIDSLRNDVARCLFPISDSAEPAPALFPAVMYCFATIDYFSSFWEGWNDSKSSHRPSKRNQNKRMTDFLCKFLLYPKKEAFVAITVWRHKLMHTSEPRKVSSVETPPKVYYWRCGTGVPHHMRLQPTDKADEFVLDFDCKVFVRDLDEGVFGPAGYFTALLRNEPGLQQNYIYCFDEMEQYKIDFSKAGL